jgi:hypothetical protein
VKRFTRYHMMRLTHFYEHNTTTKRKAPLRNKDVPMRHKMRITFYQSRPEKTLYDITHEAKRFNSDKEF